MIWYIHARLLGKALDDGFDWITYLHSYNAQVDAWTLDAHRPEHVALAQRLIAHGLDRITTNNAPALAQVLGGGRPVLTNRGLDQSGVITLGR